VAPRANVVIRERIATDVPYPTEAQADAKALELAQQRIKARLAELDPPINYEPSLDVIRNEYVRRDTRKIRPADQNEMAALNREGYHGDQLYVEYDVEVTAEQIRDLRTQERLGGALRVFAGLAAVALGAFVFLRLDERTRGYLTSWLAFAAAALAGGITAAVLLV
jgi:hypothetical protein